MSDGETRPTTEPIYYDDGEVIHACESAIIDGGVRLVWTITVEGEAPAITCPECLAATG